MCYSLYATRCGQGALEASPQMQNHWATTKREAFAQWAITLRPTSIESTLRFAGQLLALGAQEHVYRVLQTADTPAFHLSNGQSYFDYLTDQSKRAGELWAFPGSGAAETEHGRNRVTARICYYNSKGELVEADVENLGVLLEHLRADVDPRRCMGGMSHVAAVDIEHYRWDEGVSFLISLRTDIWFPSVRGWLDNSQRIGFDNRELAARHTPRLNRFLCSLFHLAQELDGDWEVLKGSPYYAEAVDLHGIRLDPA